MSAVHHGFFNTATTRTHVRFQFTTHASAGGNVAPLSAFEAADLRIYRAADGGAFSATQRSSASGITMTSPFDSLAGVHDVDIDLTDNTDSGFYDAGYLYAVMLSPDTETIDGQTITGLVLAYFEIGVQAVNVTHAAGTAWGSGAITAASLATDAGAEIADAVWDEDITTHSTTDSAGEALTAAGGAGTPPSASDIAEAVWDELLAGHLGTGSAGEAMDAAGSGGSAPSAADIADAVWDEDLTGHTTTDSSGEALGNAGGGTADVIADRLLGRNVDGGSDGGRTVSEAFQLLRNKTDIAAGTLTVYKTDDTTPSWTAAVTTSATDPISTVDPA